jgi:hypothetical protein
MQKLILLTITGQKTLSRLMRAADVFKSFKVLGVPEHLGLDFGDDVVVDADHINKCIRVLKEAFEETGSTVTFIGALSLEKRNNITKFPKSDIFWNKEIIMISDGKRWGQLAKFIRHAGFEVEEAKDGLAYITSIKQPTNN